MISQLVCVFPGYRIDSIGVDRGAQHSTVNYEPGDEGTELCGSEEVHLEHGDGMRPNRLIPELINAQLGDYWETVSFKGI